MAVFQAETLSIDSDDTGIALLKLDLPGRSVNVLTPQLLTDLDAALDYLARGTGLRLLVIRSSKTSGFLAGADIAEFAKIRTSAEAAALSARGQQLFNKLELLPMPSLAIIHGPCLGGGLELALACDYRLVIDRPNTQLGLPEIELGLLPGWGGTQRLPRVLGLERALQVILARKRLGAREALHWGLADALAASESAQREVLQELLSRLPQRGKRARLGLPLSTWRQKILESTGLGQSILLRTTRRLLRRRTWDDFPAPEEALAAVETGLDQGMTAGLAREREGASRLALSPASRNLVGLFLLREQSRKLPSEWQQPIRPLKRVGIIGAGTMGAGIAQLAALRGCEVIIKEINDDALGKGIITIENLFRKALEKGAITMEEYTRAFNAIKGRIDWQGFETLDVVVEAAVENLEIKKKIFADLEKRTNESTILATNTSSLSVAELQKGMQHPERVAGLHFFNPVHKMPLIEVIRAPHTSEETMRVLTQWALALGKTPVRVKDAPGFVVNRVLMPYMNEAVQLVAEGLGVDQVDGLMRRFGMPMGPLEVLDQIGLDVAAHVADSMLPVFGERFAPNAAFRRMSESGWLGQKKGAGFYRHRGPKHWVNRDVLPLLRAEAPAHLALVKSLPLAARLQQARERMVLLMVNEAAACLGEQLTESAVLIDLALVLGTGWAPHRGGPLRYADDRGVKEIADTLSALAGRFGPQFQPCAELQRRAQEKRPFYEH